MMSSNRTSSGAAGVGKPSNVARRMGTPVHSCLGCVQILGLQRRFEIADLTDKDKVVEHDDGSAHASLTSKYK